MKKTISILLTLILMFSMAVPAFAADYDEKPTIYVTGAQTNDLYAADGTRIYPQDTDEMAILKEAIVPCVKKLIPGLLTGDYEEYAQEFYNYFMEAYGTIGLDKNGEASNGSHPQYTIYNCGVPKKTSGYGEWDYRFWYDWRISPITAAEELKIYVDMVKEATGESKVNLMGRCYGANVIQAYITLYPEHALANVDDIAYLSSSIDGIDMLGSVFTGDFEFEDQAIENFLDFFVNNEGLIEDAEMSLFILTFVEMFNEIKMLGLTGDAVEALIDQLKYDLIPLILKDSFGSMPAYWSMVPADQYEKARAFVFDGCEDTYAGLIEKIDNYYYNVQVKTEDTLLSLSEQGIDFYIVSKYNFPDYPLFKGATAQSDGNTVVTRQSFGATTADYGEVLSDKYINSLEDTKYLSPDHKIDASTCLFPETSYFVKDLHHDSFPYSINIFAMNLMNHEATVSGGEYSQYLNYVGWYDPMVPVEGLDEDGTKAEEPKQMIFIRFFTVLLNFITKILKGEFEFSLDL